MVSNVNFGAPCNAVNVQKVSNPRSKGMNRARLREVVLIAIALNCEVGLSNRQLLPLIAIGHSPETSDGEISRLTARRRMKFRDTSAWYYKAQLLVKRDEPLRATSQRRCVLSADESSNYALSNGGTRRLSCGCS